MSHPPASLASSALQISFQRSYRQLLQFLTRKTGCAEDARELTQDLWLQLQRRTPAEADNPEAYLFTMARNLALDHLRRRQLAAAHGEAWRALHPDEPQDADAPLLLAQRHVLNRVMARLQALPERTREVFVAHRVNGIGQDELAAQHGVTRSTIERDVQRGAQAVQAALDDWHGPAAPAAAAGRRRFMGSLLGLATLGGSGALAWTLWREQAARWQAAIASAVGRQLQQTLPDGSHLTLDAASRVEVAFDRAQRRVSLLQGAAFFDVVRDVDRPFVVDARHLRVTVLGTRFAVDIREGGPEGTEIAVGVAHGRVRVAPQDGSWPALELAAGESLRSLPSREPKVQADPAVRTAAWREGWLGFRDAPLGQVVQRLQRYTGQAMAVTPGAAALPVTAEIRIAQAGEWLQALPRALPLRVQAEGGGWRIALRHER